jgi:hypothetical protein
MFFVVMGSSSDAAMLFGENAMIVALSFHVNVSSTWIVASTEERERGEGERREERGEERERRVRARGSA